MILWIALLLVAEIVWQPVACSVLMDRGNLEVEIVHNPPDENSMLDELRGHETERFPRDLKTANKTGISIRTAYEKAMNQTIEDYYAQRKAVMDRYYARQREIVDKFSRKTTTESPTSTTTITDVRRNHIPEYETSPADLSTTESTTSLSKSLNERQKNDSIVSWVNELISADSRGAEDGTETVDFQAESSNTLASRVDSKDTPGYYRLGEFWGSKDEKIVYQHNLGLGLKGSSQLEANFEVVLEGAFVITVIEAFPYANTKAHFSWISGGPGSNSVKLKLVGRENEGFSYSVKVWGVPKQK